MSIHRHCVSPSIPNVAAYALEGSCFPVEGQDVAEEGEQDEDVQAEENSGEVEAARRCRQPRTPSAREREEHERTHTPYRCWCEHCVRGQGAEYKHSTVKGTNASDEVPRVILDYCFFTEAERNAGASEEGRADSAEAQVSLTALVMKETLCGSVWAYALKSKGVSDDPWIVDQLVDDLCTIGLAQERIVVKSDQEAPIVELQSQIARKRGYQDYGVGTGIENSKVGDSNSNGKIERAIRDVGNIVRTLRLALESKIDRKIDMSMAIVP